MKECSFLFGSDTNSKSNNLLSKTFLSTHNACSRVDALHSYLKTKTTHYVDNAFWEVSRGIDPVFNNGEMVSGYLLFLFY